MKRDIVSKDPSPPFAQLSLLNEKQRKYIRKEDDDVLSWKRHSTRHAATLPSQRNMRSKVR